jgi:hypothetical protein
MLGQPDTTVVLGQGLGPNLLEPVPFAMARRQGTQTRFVSLLEPYGETPRASSFGVAAGGWLRVAGSDYEDAISFSDAGVLRLVRRSRGAIRRLALAGSTTLEWDGRLLLGSSQSISLQADFSADGRRVDLAVNGVLGGELRLYGPAVETVTLDGAPVRFRGEGEYRVLGVPRPPRRRIE